MKTNENINRDRVIKKAVVYAITFVLISAVIIPTINAQFINKFQKKWKSK